MAWGRKTGRVDCWSLAADRATTSSCFCVITKAIFLTVFSCCGISDYCASRRPYNGFFFSVGCLACFDTMQSCKHVWVPSTVVIDIVDGGVPAWAVCFPLWTPYSSLS